jgi:hypothetical protein
VNVEDAQFHAWDTVIPVYESLRKVQYRRDGATYAEPKKHLQYGERVFIEEYSLRS